MYEYGINAGFDDLYSFIFQYFLKQLKKYFHVRFNFFRHEKKYFYSFYYMHFFLIQIFERCFYFLSTVLNYDNLSFSIEQNFVVLPMVISKVVILYNTNRVDITKKN